MNKFALLIAYQGSDFCGWQKQRGSAAAGAPSIQETLEIALEAITGESRSVVGSGRTDAGVHSAGQVAHISLESDRWSAVVIRKGLNAKLPRSIRILSVLSVAEDFHAQRSAERKQYSFVLQTGPTPLPYWDPLSWWIRADLDLGAMRQALETLQGEHDFGAFQASGGVIEHTVREIFEASVDFEPLSFPFSGVEAFGLIRIRVVGSGFLKQMVRSIAGTLVQVGEGKLKPSCFQEVLERQDRSLLGPTAPARGLWLEKVWYSSNLEWFDTDGSSI